VKKGVVYNRTWRDDELNHLEACNLPDTPGMDLRRLVQQGPGAPAQLRLVTPAQKEP